MSIRWLRDRFDDGAAWLWYTLYWKPQWKRAMRELVEINETLDEIERQRSARAL